MFKFKHPFTCIIAGPTQSGKTFFTFELLRNINELISPEPPENIIWCYGEYQQKLAGLPALVDTERTQIKVVEGLGGIDMIDPEKRNLIILDDLMYEIGNVEEIAELFTKGSHHRNLSVILIVQNLFHQAKIMRTISLNAHYMVLFKNPRDALQVKHLASQLFPGQSRFLTDAYKQATSRPHGYLLLDLTQTTPDDRRVISDILPSQRQQQGKEPAGGEEEDDEFFGYYYVPKK